YPPTVRYDGDSVFPNWCTTCTFYHTIDTQLPFFRRFHEVVIIVPILSRFRDNTGINGVTNPTTQTMSFTDTSASHFVQGRPTIRVEKITERPIQRASECDRPKSEGALVKVSVALQTGRALPKLPLDMYSAICKGHKANVAFFDEDGNPTYESIDPESDSLIDPLYTKLGEVTSSRPERKYDYPVFSGRKAPAFNLAGDGVVYQSASQIYTICGSEDPYSSIVSEPHRSATVADQDDYNSSVYDGGYAKVKQGPLNNNWRRERLERTELEVDQLYSKIRRSSNVDDTVSVVEPSQLEAENKVLDHFASDIPPECSKVCRLLTLCSTGH
ncbi:hypothetical protein ANCCAN_16487, partial [Ancylostoma caninum]